MVSGLKVVKNLNFFTIGSMNCFLADLSYHIDPAITNSFAMAAIVVEGTALRNGDKILCILDALHWPHTGGGGRSLAHDFPNFLLGTTLGAARSSGFHEVFVKDNGKEQGFNRRIVPSRMCKDEQQLQELWDLLRDEVAAVDAVWTFTSVQVNLNFGGKPHRDSKDKSFQYACALGSYQGGCLHWKEDEQHFLSDTCGRLTKFDGRHLHWVEPYKGKRYSVIMFRNTGPEQPWHYSVEAKITHLRACAFASIQRNREAKAAAAKRVAACSRPRAIGKRIQTTVKSVKHKKRCKKNKAKRAKTNQQQYLGKNKRKQVALVDEAVPEKVQGPVSRRLLRKKAHPHYPAPALMQKPSCSTCTSEWSSRRYPDGRPRWWRPQPGQLMCHCCWQQTQ